MFDIQEWLISIFGSSGEAGLIICVFLIFLIDGLGVPTLPELFIVGAFMYDPDNIMFGIELLLAAISAEIIGVSVLYWIVGHLTVPKRIQNIMNKYVNFLILKDERLLLLNRIAPMLPLSGAFVSVAGWDIRKALMYVVIGCIMKYGLILIMSNFFFSYFSGGDAQLVTFAFIFGVIGVSFVASIVAKKRLAPKEDQSEN